MTIRPQSGVHSSTLISVIMPCYQGERFLREAVDSVLGQTHPHVELIVVDDGSTDGSMEILRSYGDRIEIMSQANQGPYRARNAALEKARGEFVAFLDADDYWEPEFLERLQRALVLRADAVLAYCGWQHVGAVYRSNQPFVPRDYEVPDKVDLLLSGGSPWPIHAALVRSTAVDEIGGFREDLNSSLDFEFWLRLAATSRVVLVPEVLAYYRFHGDGQISSRPWRQAINGWQIKYRFLAEYRKAHAGWDALRARRIADATLLQRGYDFYWRRDLKAARHVFRKCLMVGIGKWSDMRYLLPAMLPERPYLRLIEARDRE